MVGLKLKLFAFFVIVIGLVGTQDVEEHNIRVTENRIAAQIFAILDHYKQDDPVGIPGAPISEPMLLPGFSKNFVGARLSMKEIQAHGVSKFRIKYIKTDPKNLKVSASIQLDNINVTGVYTATGLFLDSSKGPFSIFAKDVVVSGNTSLYEKNGCLLTQHIKMDITFSDILVHFKNLGVTFLPVQVAINTAPNLVFDAMKPMILADVYKKLRKEIDTNLEKALGDQRLPNSVAPLDIAIAEARKKVKQMSYDPFRIPNINRTVGIFSMEMSNIWISGLSSFYRFGNITINMENNTVTAKLSVGAQKMYGSTTWDVSFGKGLFSRSGQTQFTVQYIKATIDISLPLDTKKHAKINDLQFDVGNIQMRMDGAGTLDYIAEFIVNLLPNLLRHQVVHVVTGPIKLRLQEELNQIDIEEAIRMNVQNFENMSGDLVVGFKL